MNRIGVLASWRFKSQTFRPSALGLFFRVSSVAMARGRQMRVPARRGAEHQLEPAAVAGRDGALQVSLSERDRFAAHRAHGELSGHEVPPARLTYLKGV